MILAIGDSNMYPACTERLNKEPDQNNLVSIFSRELNRPFKCWAKDGASNYWIQHHLEYFLASKNQNTFLFVGWTSVDREEWPWQYENISVCGGPNFGMPDAMKERFDQWKTTHTPEFRKTRTEYWHQVIHSYHTRLLELNIPHLFWNAYESFKSVDTPLEWHNNFFKPYDNNGSMYDYLISQGILPFENDPYHFSTAAHQQWALTLSKYKNDI